MGKRVYYKAVRNNLRSFNSIANTDNGIIVQYKIGQYVKPKIKGTGLLVFDTLDDAKDFISWMSTENYKLFSCHIVGNINLGHYTAFTYSVESIKRAWEANTGDQYVCSWPKGTVAVKKVKLLEEIKI